MAINNTIHRLFYKVRDVVSSLVISYKFDSTKVTFDSTQQTMDRTT